jgi:hypothetical protein
MESLEPASVTVPFIGHNPGPKALHGALGAIDRKGSGAVICVAEP